MCGIVFCFWIAAGGVTNFAFLHFCLHEEAAQKKGKKKNGSSF